MVRCCDNCVRESTPSGIARHRKYCTEYKQFAEKRHAFGLRVADAKLNSQHRKAKTVMLQAQQQEPVSVQDDDTVSISFFRLSSEVPYKL